MTKDEIETEAKGWFSLVRAKEREISVAELDVRRKNREIAQLEKQKAAAAELAKATQEVKAAGNDKDKEAAAEASRRGAENPGQDRGDGHQGNRQGRKKGRGDHRRDGQAGRCGAAAGRHGDGFRPAAAKVATAAGDKDVLQKAAETAAKKSEAAGDTAKVEKVVAASEKEAAADRPDQGRWRNPRRRLPEKRWRRGSARQRRPRRSPTLRKRRKNSPRRPTKPGRQDRRQGPARRLQHAIDERTHRARRPPEARPGQMGGSRAAIRRPIGSTSPRSAASRSTSPTGPRPWRGSPPGSPPTRAGLRWARNLATFFGYILGSIIVAWIVRMILRRVMARRRG